MENSYPMQARNTVRRHRERAKYDFETVHSIVNASPILHVSFLPTNPADDGYGRTPLSCAASKGYKEVIQLLLDTDDVDLFSKDKFYHRTPGMWAAVGGHSDVARLLQYEEPEEEAEEEDAEEEEIEEPKKVVLVTPAGELVLI